jgi:cell division protein FtsL
VLFAAAVVVVGAVFVIGLGQNLLGTQQVRLDLLQQQLAAASQANENLLLDRAQLEAPARILQLAEHGLGMVAPKSVVYLTPVSPGPSVSDEGEEPHGASR